MTGMLSKWLSFSPKELEPMESSRLEPRGLLEKTWLNGPKPEEAVVGLSSDTSEPCRRLEGDTVVGGVGFQPSGGVFH